MKEWSQIFYLDRERDGPDGNLEMIVYGGVDPKTDELIVTKIETLDGETLELTSEETQQAVDCLYDSIYNYTGSGPKYFDK